MTKRDNKGHKHAENLDWLLAEDSLVVRVQKMSLLRLGFIVTLLLHPLILIYLMRPGTYSRYSYYISLTMTAYMLSSLGLRFGMHRFLLQYLTQNRPGLIYPTIIYVLQLTLKTALVGIAVFVCLFFISPGIFDGEVILLAVVCLSLLAATINDWLYSVHYGLRQYYWWAFNFFCFGLVRLFIVPGFYLLWGFEAALLGIALSYFMTFFICSLTKRDLINGVKKLKEPGVSIEKKALFTYSIPVYLSRIFRKGAHPLGVLVLALITAKTNEQVAFFHLAVLGVNVCSMLLDGLLFSIFPEVAKSIDEEDSKATNRWLALETKYMLLASAIIAGIVFVFASVGVKIIPQKYWPVELWLRIAILTLLIRAVQLPLVHLYHAQKRTASYLKVMSLWLVCYLIIYPLGAHYIGGWGVLAGFLFGEIIVALGLFIGQRKEIESRKLISLFAGIVALSLMLFIPYFIESLVFKSISFVSILTVWSAALWLTGLIDTDDWQRVKRFLSLRTVFASGSEGQR